jgi:hypothetical protein
VKHPKKEAELIHGPAEAGTPTLIAFYAIMSFAARYVGKCPCGTAAVGSDISWEEEVKLRWVRGWMLWTIIIASTGALSPECVLAAESKLPATTSSDAPAAVPEGMTSLFDGKTLDSWIQIPPKSWIVKDGAMASTGAGRGVIYTKEDYGNYRLMFTMRHVMPAAKQKGDHQPCILIFCTRPAQGEKGLDALGGIQFQVPNGSHWDYRPGQNKSGKGFKSPARTKFDNKQWFRVEILVDAEAGTARMAVAQPVGAKAVENLDYKMPEAGKKGPVAWQMHNKGLLDEYKDVVIEVNPKVKDLITTK